ncbi:MAG: type I restriction enzyme HsdR N-terminal domain-containing protein [Flavobacteriales bacterium]|tara:strand:- start:2213 stop:2632 length:420 start_codon:yes stop_codon:yes gene_type:complete
MKTEQGSRQIFDPVRKKMVKLDPEEWVRQNLIQFLNKDKNYPISLMAVEKGLTVNKLSKRFDILCYNNDSKPLLLVECKAPSVKISQAAFDQISIYNLQFKVPFLLVSNGLEHYCCQLDYEKNSYSFLSEIPDYQNYCL